MTWTLGTVLFIITAWVVFGSPQPMQWHGEPILSAFGIVPARFHAFTLLTSLFFHAGFGHLAGNLLYLGVFGAGVEAAVGRTRYLLLFLAGGVFGGTLQWLITDRLLSPDAANLPIVGASAACAALMGLYARRYYRTERRIFHDRLRVHVVAVVGIFLLLEVVSGLWNLVTGAVTDGVAHWSHIGGFIFGLVVGQVMGLEAEGNRAYLTGGAARAMSKSNPGEAVKRWEVLLAREPNNATAWAELARAWLLLGDTEQASTHFQKAIGSFLAQGKRAEAALIYAEMRDAAPNGHTLATRDGNLTTAQLFLIGNALEDLEQFDLAADTLRAVTIREPNPAQSEVALLKVITLYIQRLDRKEEASVLLRIFEEKYPRSQWRTLAADLKKAAKT